MTPVPRSVRCLLAAGVAVALVACGGGPSFDPAGPCSVDGRTAGAYPALEALVPRSLDGRPPDRLDSGRSCTDGALASLATHGVRELRFAGGLWEQGNNSGTTLAVFDSPGALDAAWVAEFYEAGARGGKRTDRIEVRQETGFVGETRFWLETLNDESYQTVVVWQRGEHVEALLVASSVRETVSRDAHDTRVRQAQLAFAGSP